MNEMKSKHAAASARRSQLRLRRRRRRRRRRLEGHVARLAQQAQAGVAQQVVPHHKQAQAQKGAAERVAAKP